LQPPEAGGALAAQSAHVAAQAFSARRRTLAFVVVALAFVMDLLDVTIVHVALPSIRAGLGAGASALQWTIAGYALAFAVLLVSGGRLGDVFGYRRLFLVGVAAFTLASGLCGLAMAPWQLVAARGLQGASGALMVPQVMALMQVMYPPQERFRVFAIFGLLGGVSAALGPVVGGLLIEADLFGLGWRSAFLINLPVGLLSLVAGARLLPHGAGTQPKRVDGVGTLLATATALALVLPLMQGPEAGWPAWCAALLVLALPLALLTWKAWQRRQARDGAALVDPALLAQPALRLGLTAGLALHGVVPAYLLVMTFVVQGGLHASPEQMALLCVPIAAGAAFGIAVLSQRVVPRWGHRLGGGRRGGAGRGAGADGPDRACAARRATGLGVRPAPAGRPRAAGHRHRPDRPGTDHRHAARRAAGRSRQCLGRAQRSAADGRRAGTGRGGGRRPPARRARWWLAARRSASRWRSRPPPCSGP
jgi:MFS family permease